MSRCFLAVLLLYVIPIPTLPARGDEPEPSVETDEPAPVGPALPPPIAGRDSGLRIDLSLDEAVAIALGRNLDVNIETLNAYQQHQNIGIASAAFDPLFSSAYTMSKFRQPTVDTLSGLGSTTSILVNPFETQSGNIGISGLMPIGTTYRLEARDDRSDNPNSTFFGFNPRNSTSITASINQPLLKDFGYDVNLADLRIARESSAMARQELEAQVNETIRSVIDAYWNLYFTYKDLEVRRSSLREAEQLLEINQHKLAAGTAKEVDVTQAQANIADQTSGIIQAENAVLTAQDTLLDLLNYKEVLREKEQLPRGRALYEHVRIALTTPLDFEEIHIDLENAIALALEQRPDLRRARHAIRSATHAFRRADHNTLPTLDLSASWTQLGLEKSIGDSWDELFSGRYYSWTVALNFEYAIGNRAAHREHFRAKAALESSRLELERLENLAVLEVSRAVRDIRNAYRTVVARREQVRLQRETLAGERERLRVGISTSFQVFEIQNDLLDAESQELRARVDYKNAITAYSRAVGVLRSEYSSVDPEE
ncbi:MAG: TolC family protein [Planctomycetes bacterium]|nr:TolC family protein [Planctomycetota bacterium]